MLSGDVLMLEALGVVVARRIDAIRLVQERDDRGRREQEMATLAAEAELRALRAQLNPHFLFNALTTIGYLIQTAPPKALRTLMRLTALLRSVLRSEGTLTTLGRELEIVEAYLEIERARFEDRLQVQIDVPGELRSCACRRCCCSHWSRMRSSTACRPSVPADGLRSAPRSIGPRTTPASCASRSTTRAWERPTRCSSRDVGAA